MCEAQQRKTLDIWEIFCIKWFKPLRLKSPYLLGFLHLLFRPLILWAPPHPWLNHMHPHLHRWDHSRRCTRSTNHTSCSPLRVRRRVPLRSPPSPWGPCPRGRKWSSHVVWMPSSSHGVAPLRVPPSRSQKLLPRLSPQVHSSTAFCRSTSSPDWTAEETPAAGQPSPPPRPCWPWRSASWRLSAATFPRSACRGVCWHGQPAGPADSHLWPMSAGGRISERGV